MHQEMVTIPKKEYDELKKMSEIDFDILHQLLSSFRDIREGRVRKVR